MLQKALSNGQKQATLSRFSHFKFFYPPTKSFLVNKYWIDKQTYWHEVLVTLPCTSFTHYSLHLLSHIFFPSNSRVNTHGEASFLTEGFSAAAFSPLIEGPSAAADRFSWLPETAVPFRPVPLPPPDRRQTSSMNAGIVEMKWGEWI